MRIGQIVMVLILLADKSLFLVGICVVVVDELRRIQSKRENEAEEADSKRKGSGLI